MPQTSQTHLQKRTEHQAPRKQRALWCAPVCIKGPRVCARSWWWVGEGEWGRGESVICLNVLKPPAGDIAKEYHRMPPKGDASRRNLSPFLGSRGIELILLSSFQPDHHWPAQGASRFIDLLIPLQLHLHVCPWDPVHVTRSLCVYVYSETCVSRLGHVIFNRHKRCHAIARIPFPSPPSAVLKACPVAVCPPRCSCPASTCGCCGRRIG